MHLDALQSLAHALATAQSADAVLRQVVQGLGMTPGVALARVWLIQKDEGESAHLRLRASIGASIVEPGLRWNSIDGNHAKIPLSFGKVGRVARENQALLLHRGVDDWLVHPDWADAEQIESFAAQPLIFKEQVLGVLAFFSRERLNKSDLRWLRVYADHAALAVQSARVNEELARLKEAAEQERDYLRAEMRQRQHPTPMVAESRAMKHVLQQAEAIAQSDSPALVTGESGVGKELIATAVHDLSQRREGPLVKVNCASIPKELFESEFFGHVRGAFSGAVRDRQGRFALADKGTLFLDEVGEIPLFLQSKLLRVLQEKTYEMVGDERTRKVNVRVIAATNRDLAGEVKRGAFREDLYYRLSVLPILVPPLRDRREDIIPLAQRFLSATARRLNLPLPQLSEADRKALSSYDFPGNVRELSNVIERALVLGAAEKRKHLHLSSQLSPARLREKVEEDLPKDRNSAQILSANQVRDFETANMQRALELCEWRIAGEQGAARLLEMSPSTLTYRMRQHGLTRPDDDS